jgi:hypothetical protein
MSLCRWPSCCSQLSSKHVEKISLVQFEWPRSPLKLVSSQFHNYAHMFGNIDRLSHQYTTTLYGSTVSKLFFFIELVLLLGLTEVLISWSQSSSSCSESSHFSACPKLTKNKTIHFFGHCQESEIIGKIFFSRSFS